MEYVSFTADSSHDVCSLQHLEDAARRMQVVVLLESNGSWLPQVST